MNLGGLAPLSVKVTDAAGNPANAATIALSIVQPDGTVVTPAVPAPTTVGTYVYYFLATQVGRHQAHWTSTSPQAAYSDTFDVRDIAAGSILSLADAKAALNMTSASTKDDSEVRDMVEAVTAVIERFRAEAVVRRTVVEQNVAGYGNRFVLGKKPVISFSQILDYQLIPQDLTRWTLDAQNGTLTNYRYRWYNGRDITVTYVAGYNEVPANYILAAKIILGHLWSTQRIQNIGQQITLGSRAKPEELINTPQGVGYSIPMRALELLGARPSLVV